MTPLDMTLSDLESQIQSHSAFEAYSLRSPVRQYITVKHQQERIYMGSQMAP